MEFKLLENETNDEFVYKVSKYKCDTESMSWQEVADICNKELQNDFGESTYRKQYQSFLKFLDMALAEYVSDDRILDIEEKKDELYKQQVKTRDKIREYRSTLRNQARFDNLKDVILESVEIISQQKPFLYEYKSKDISTDKLGLLLLSDMHYGITIDNFMNKYDKNICKERINKVVVETIETSKIMGVKDLKIVNLGDAINGLLHLGNRVENEEDVITQIMEITEIIAEMINEFAPHFNSIEYIDCLDNHSRVNANKNLSLEEENFGRLISWYLKPRLKNISNVNIVSERFDDTITKFDILGETCFAVHGHKDKLSNLVQKMTLMTKIIPMSVFSAHVHHHFEKDEMGIDIIVNGTLSGTDTYAKEIRLTSKATQKFLVYEKDDDKVYRSITKHIVF